MEPNPTNDERLFKIITLIHSDRQIREDCGSNGCKEGSFLPADVQGDELPAGVRGVAHISQVGPANDFHFLRHLSCSVQEVGKGEIKRKRPFRALVSGMQQVGSQLVACLLCGSVGREGRLEIGHIEI